MNPVVYPPGPRANVPLQMARALRHDLVGFLKDAAAQYGDLVYFKAGPQQIFVLHHLDYIKEVLVTQSRKFVKSRGLQMAKRIML